MLKNTILLLVGLALCLIPTVRAANIIYVSENDDQNADGVIDDIRWPAWLAEQGFTVSVQRNNWLTLDAAKIATLNQADLVIVSRNTDSGDYANSGEAAQWNGITAPMLMMTPYLPRGSRWNWVGSEGLTVVAGAPVWEALVPGHQVFFGLPVGVNPQVSALDGTVSSLGTAHMGATVDVGNGTVIARVPGTGEQAIVEWQAGKEFRAGGPVAAGRRLFFCVGTTESATTPQGAFNLTPVGQQIFINAVNYMLGIAPPEAGQALTPRPEDKATGVATDTVVSWRPGELASQHDVYFGSTLADVNTASRTSPQGVLASQGQDANMFDPTGLLAFGQTYYWRIDEVQASASAIMRGAVWSLTTEPYSYAVRPITATASSSINATMGPEKTIDGSGLSASDQHSLLATDMWLSSKSGPQPTWIQYEFDRAYRLHQMWVWNSNQAVELDAGFGIKTAAIEYSADGSSWTALAGVPEFSQATGEPNYVHNTTVEFGGAMAKYVRLTLRANWADGTTQGGLSEVRFFYVPTKAYQPVPAQASANVIMDAVLSWRPGREAVRHDLYLSTDANAVIQGTALVKTGTEHSCPLSSLGIEYGRTYYWKVNEVNDAAVPAVWEGDVWSFTTSDYSVIDDFESYNDACRRIFFTWVDGFGYSATPNCGVKQYPGNGTGSAVGNAQPPFAEQANFHGGRQAMPFFYDNTGNALSETERTFDSAQDWTRGGAKTLVLFFSGNRGNAAGELYLKINGSKVVFGGGAEAIAKPWWSQWNVDLASVGGNLQAVKTLTLGVSGGSGKGVLYVDDIRLYRAASGTATEEVWIEAESASSLPLAWDLLSDKPDASDGKYLAVKAGNASMTAPPTDGAISCKFTVKGGTYKLFARSIVPTADDNSLWVRINGSTPQTAINASGWVWWYDVAVGSNWHWDAVRSHDDADKTVLFTLPAGTYTLEAGYREDGLLLDAFVMTNKLD